MLSTKVVADGHASAATPRAMDVVAPIPQRTRSSPPAPNAATSSTVPVAISAAPHNSTRPRTVGSGHAIATVPTASHEAASTPIGQRPTGRDRSEQEGEAEDHEPDTDQPSRRRRRVARSCEQQQPPSGGADRARPRRPPQLGRAILGSVVHVVHHPRLPDVDARVLSDAGAERCARTGRRGSPTPCLQLQAPGRRMISGRVCSALRSRSRDHDQQDQEVSR